VSEAHEVEEAYHAKCVLSEVQGRVSVTTVLATNLFERAPDRWRMVHHHASHVLGLMPEAAA